jgi:glutamate-1-semialdehyde 2,1-aminomutase
MSTLLSGPPETTATPPVRGAGQRLYTHARTIIPGGTQLLSKRPELYLPEQWPAYYNRARGVEVWDLDGERYIDFASSGIGAPILGFADPDVDAAVKRAIDAGTMCTLNCPEEVELAELLLELHPWAEMARFARGGGEVLAIAVRIARAATGRDLILFCGYHGWQDWYLAANLRGDDSLNAHLLAGLEPAGVPRGLTNSILAFRYNAIEEFRALIDEHGSRVAAIVMEPSRSTGPAPGFLEEIRATATRIGAALVFDEVTSGWRVNTGGIHLTFGVAPDLAAFAKAMGNGYPVSAVIGRREIMEAAQSTFISSTSWTERVGPTAALATIRKHRDRAVPAHLLTIGKAVQEGLQGVATATGLDLAITGIYPLTYLAFGGPHGAALATLYIQEMLDRGYLTGTSFYPTFAHTLEHVEAYLRRVEEVFPLLARVQADGSADRHLRGPVKHSGFQRLT